MATKKLRRQKPGPPKRFLGRLEIRAPEEDIDLWKAEAAGSPERLELSQWVRGLLNRAVAHRRK